MARVVCVLLAVILLAFAGWENVEAKSQHTVLREVLQHFNETRNNAVNVAAKKKARDYIVASFEGLGLKTWTEEFPSGNAHPGINVIGKLPGQNAGTAKDSILLIGTHYDSVRTSPGVDDNGSGMTAMLTAIMQFLSSNKMKCTRSSTLYFVAFDLEEEGLLGSEAFLQNFTAHLSTTGATFQGAVILDTVMNYNTSANSQRLPTGIDALLPDLHKAIKDDKFRGNFLTAIGRLNDTQLLSTFAQEFKNDDDFKLRNVALPFVGRPSDLNGSKQADIGDFLRSDHTRFWNADLRAIFLTDSADFRGYMKTCYHRPCDDMSKVTNEMIAFLGTTTDALASLASNMTGEKCTWKKTTNSEVLTADSGELTSPYYPNDYPNGVAAFLWKITPGDDRKDLELSFEEFQLESSDNCTADNVTIYDVYDDEKKPVGKYCGTNIPKPIQAKGKALWVMFMSDQFVTNTGFKAKWTTQKIVKSGAGISGRTAWILVALLPTAWAAMFN